jgi:hypothetical protein
MDRRRIEERMTALAMARIGATVGAAYTAPVVVWLMPQIWTNGLDSGLLLQTALRAAWIGGALALVAFATSGLGRSLAETLLGVATAIAVSLPLCSLAWLAASASAGTLAAGLVFLAACGGSIALLDNFVRRVPSAEVEFILRAGLQAATVAAAWGWRDQWLAWIGT